MFNSTQQAHAKSVKWLAWRHSFYFNSLYCWNGVLYILQFFAHPVLYNLMKKKWWGKFGEMKKYSWLDRRSWTWFFLNLWCLFDLVLFPVLFAVFYIKHRINNVTRVNKGRVFTFLLNVVFLKKIDWFTNNLWWICEQHMRTGWWTVNENRDFF